MTAITAQADPFDFVYDPDTTALVGYLGGRLAAARVLLLGAARDDEGGTRLADLRGHDFR